MSEQDPIITTPAEFANFVFDQADEIEDSPDPITAAGHLMAVGRVATEFMHTYAAEAIDKGELSQRRVAKLLGVHQTTISRWVRATHKVEINHNSIEE